MRSRLISSFLQRRTLFHECYKLNVNNARARLNNMKAYSTEKNTRHKNSNVEIGSHNLASSIGSTHKVFDDGDAEIILDVNERREAINVDDLRTEEVKHDPYEGIDLTRGKTGVFEIEDLVTLLRRDNAKNIFVAAVPPEYLYVNYIVVVTGKSLRHMKALATFVRKVYKLKRHKTDLIPKIEGENSKDWIALDLGNIALHIFSSTTRSLYDLETLWSVGPEHDDKCKDSTFDIMEQYNTFISNLEPLEDNDDNVK